jgi:inositol hexakisphosphate/diphosphoinositol-pentakisphosphate kinase
LTSVRLVSKSLCVSNPRAVAPQEYGIERDEKEEIGLLTSLPLLSKIIEDLKAATEAPEGSGSYYFTKESHMCVFAPTLVRFDRRCYSQTLVNLVLFSDLQIVMPQIPELDYLVSWLAWLVSVQSFLQSYVTFETHERMGAASEKEFSVRISLSEGAHGYPLDVSLDAKHALQVQPRK